MWFERIQREGKKRYKYEVQNDTGEKKRGKNDVCGLDGYRLQGKGKNRIQLKHVVQKDTGRR